MDKQTSSNPLLRVRNFDENLLNEKPMSISNTVNKTMFLTLIVVLFGCYTWNLCATGFADKANLITIVSLISGFILALITTFKPSASPITAPIYALCEGLLLGSVSWAYNSLSGGIVINAVSLSILTLFVMLFLFQTKLIQATEKFKQTIFIATAAIAVFYLISIITALFGHPLNIFNGSLVGIGINLIICVIAALNFITDFDMIKRMAENNAPSYCEWYGAFGLLVTIVWLYLEILRLLAQLQSRK